MTYPIDIAAPVLIFAALIAGVLFIEAVVLLGILWRRLRGRPPMRRWAGRLAIMMHALAAVVLACVLYGTVVEPYWPEVTVVRLQTSKLNETTLRIVQISDTHCDRRARLEPRLPGIVNALEPDVVVFTGDAVNTPRAVPLFQAMLAAMEAPLGKFAVRGNWDYMVGTALFEGTGFEELALRAVRLEKDGQAFMIGGVNYHQGRISQRAIHQFDATTWNLLLYHAPDLARYMTDTPVDLFVCGHTHGGQVALPFVGALVQVADRGKGFNAGLYRVGQTTVYVNRGVGMGGFGPRVRFLARPEITLFEIDGIGDTIQHKQDDASAE